MREDVAGTGLDQALLGGLLVRGDGREARHCRKILGTGIRVDVEELLKRVGGNRNDGDLNFSRCPGPSLYSIGRTISPQLGLLVVVLHELADRLQLTDASLLVLP